MHAEWSFLLFLLSRTAISLLGGAIWISRAQLEEIKAAVMLNDRYVVRHVLDLNCRSRGEKSKASAMEVQARVSSKVTENIRELPPVLLMEED